MNNRRTDIIKIRFSEKDCSRCPSLAGAFDRSIMELYANCCGIEGTVSQGVRVCRLRRTRYRGFAKTYLDHTLTATAIKCLRLSEWIAGPDRATTQHSHLSRLLALAC